MWWVPGVVPIKFPRKFYKKQYQEDKNMLKLYTRKLKKAWEDTATPITVNKREMILEFALCALTGVVVGMLVSPRKNQTFGSYNTGAVNNNTQPLAAADSDEEA